MDAGVGREGELARIATLWSRAAAGRGQFVLITGEAGIGKSWLALAASAAVRATGVRVLRGWTLEDPAAPALWLWRRVARDLTDLSAAIRSFEHGSSDVEARLRLSDALAEHLSAAAGGGGLVLVLEDLHWADELSLDVLRRLLPALEDLPVLLIGTAREDAATGSAFVDVLPRLARGPSTEHLALAGLDARTVRRWLDADPETAPWASRADEVTRLTGGNPFYVRSLTTELRTSPLADVEAALACRPAWRTILIGPLGDLPAPARRTLTQAAVLGERIVPDVLADALELAVDEVHEHVAAGVNCGLLQAGDGGPAFGHVLVRDAIIASLPAAELADAHARAGRALADTGNPLVFGLAATHWSAVAGPQAARRCRDLATAAARALTFAPARGADLARLAVTAAQSLGADPAELAERLLLQARLEWAAGRLHPAATTCAAVLDLAQSVGRPELMADAALVLQGAGDPDLAVRVDAMTRRALARLPGAETTRTARLLALSAVTSAELAATTMTPAATGGADPAAVSRAALALARHGGDAQAELETIAARHFVLSHPLALEDRSRLAARALELAPSAATTMGAIWGQLWTADLAFQRGDLQGVRHCIHAVEEVATVRASPIARWHGLRLRAALDMLLGQLDAARRTALQARQVAERVGDWSMIGMHHAFHINLALLRADPDDLLPDWEAVLRHAPPMPLVRISIVLVRGLLGDLEGARAALAPFRGLPERFPLGPRWLGTVGQIGAAAVFVEDADLARSCYDLLGPCAPWCAADGGGSPVAGGSVELSLGALALTFGDLGCAAGHFERAILVDERIGAAPDAARARLGLARCLAGQAPTRALGLARTAAAELTRLDLAGPARDATALVHRLDDGTTRRSEECGLTEREAEVAVLVAQALTNQQIADRLVLSVRTVESHVRSILAKLALTSRTQIAVRLRDWT